MPAFTMIRPLEDSWKTPVITIPFRDLDGTTEGSLTPTWSTRPLMAHHFSFPPFWAQGWLGPCMTGGLPSQIDRFLIAGNVTTRG